MIAWLIFRLRLIQQRTWTDKKNCPEFFYSPGNLVDTFEASACFEIAFLIKCFFLEPEQDAGIK